MDSRLRKQSTKESGDAAEALALRHLLRHGLVLLRRNYRVAHGPRAKGGEVDLILRDTDGTLVFVEVRARGSASHGGAAASVTRTKQQRIAYAARHFLQGLPSWPPCRFDVVAVEGGEVSWLRAAFEAPPG